MTKSQRSDTKKLQLARLFRWLAVLCFIKLCIFSMILFDFPFPALFNKSVDTLQTSTAKQSPVEPQERREETWGERHEEIQGAPLPLVKTDDKKGTNEVPAPIRAGNTYHARISDDISPAPILKTPDFPLPDPLPAPIAEPGTIALEEERVPSKTLPVPTLGSVTVAQAAASMPVPQSVVPTQSMTPIEQQSALTQQNTTAMPVPTVAPRPSSAGPTGQLPTAQSGVAGQNRAPARPLPVSTDAEDIARQQQDMLVLKKQMDERIKELQDSEAKVKRMLNEARGLEKEKIKTLIQMFGNMKPKTAAKAIENMDERTACRILEGLTPKQSGDILSYTNPAVTAKLTEHLSHIKMK